MTSRTRANARFGNSLLLPDPPPHGGPHSGVADRQLLSLARSLLGCGERELSSNNICSTLSVNNSLNELVSAATTSVRSENEWSSLEVDVSLAELCLFSYESAVQRSFATFTDAADMVWEMFLFKTMDKGRRDHLSVFVRPIRPLPVGHIVQIAFLAYSRHQDQCYHIAAANYRLDNPDRCTVGLSEFIPMRAAAKVAQQTHIPDILQIGVMVNVLDRKVNNGYNMNLSHTTTTSTSNLFPLQHNPAIINNTTLTTVGLPPLHSPSIGRTMSSPSVTTNVLDDETDGKVLTLTRGPEPWLKWLKKHTNKYLLALKHQVWPSVYFSSQITPSLSTSSSSSSSLTTLTTTTAAATTIVVDPINGSIGRRRTRGQTHASSLSSVCSSPSNDLQTDLNAWSDLPLVHSPTSSISSPLSSSMSTGTNVVTLSPSILLVTKSLRKSREKLNGTNEVLSHGQTCINPKKSIKSSRINNNNNNNNNIDHLSQSNCTTNVLDIRHTDKTLAALQDDKAIDDISLILVEMKHGNENWNQSRYHHHHHSSSSNSDGGEHTTHAFTIDDDEQHHKDELYVTLTRPRKRRITTVSDHEHDGDKDELNRKSINTNKMLYPITRQRVDSWRSPATEPDPPPPHPTSTTTTTVRMIETSCMGNTINNNCVTCSQQLQSTPTSSLSMSSLLAAVSAPIQCSRRIDTTDECAMSMCSDALVDLTRYPYTPANSTTDLSYTTTDVPITTATTSSHLSSPPSQCIGLGVSPLQSLSSVTHPIRALCAMLDTLGGTSGTHLWNLLQPHHLTQSHELDKRRDELRDEISDEIRDEIRKEVHDEIQQLRQDLLLQQQQTRQLCDVLMRRDGGNDECIHCGCRQST